MTANRFGGRWTEDKLNVLKDYLLFYVQALKNTKFELLYIDSFAGTGQCRVKTPTGHKNIDGSAKIALDCVGFNRYHFIERKRTHAAELQQLLHQHPRGGLAVLERGEASHLLTPLLDSKDWRRSRGVLFLDPYGLQCDWPTVQRVAATKALDVFFLVSLSGLYRNAAIDLKAVDDAKSRALTRFLGTEAWRAAVYVHEQNDLWQEPLVTRARGAAGLLQFTTDRLRGEFPYVSEPCLLGTANNAPLFALYFAVSNPHKSALDLATKVSKHVLSRLG